MTYSSAKLFIQWFVLDLPPINRWVISMLWGGCCIKNKPTDKPYILWPSLTLKWRSKFAEKDEDSVKEDQQEPPIPRETPSSSSNEEEEGEEGEMNASNGAENRALGLFRRFPLTGISDLQHANNQLGSRFYVFQPYRNIIDDWGTWNL